MVGSFSSNFAVPARWSTAESNHEHAIDEKPAHIRDFTGSDSRIPR